MKRAFKNKYLYILMSIILSLLLHLMLFILMMKVIIFPNILNKPAKFTRTMKIVHRPSPAKKDISQTAVSSAPGALPKVTERAPAKLPGENGSLAAKGKYDIPIPDKTPLSSKTPILPSIISVDADKLSSDRMAFDRNLIPKLPRTSKGNYIFRSSGKGPGGTDNIGLLSKLPPPEKINKTLPTTPDTRMIPDEKAIRMDPLMDVSIYKYPLPYGGGFFRIDISPNKKAAALKTFNKDVIMLIDVSGSIGRRRLSEFKEGIQNALPTLKRNDRMNIVAFKSKNYPMSEVPVSPTKENLKKAEMFLFKLDHGGTTNVYSALKPYVGSVNRVKGRPLIIFLLSDGQVNTGEVVGSRDLINAVSNRNLDGAAIYTYSCGGDRNSFLMDLLSYRNRGESLNIPEIRGSNKPLTQFINAVSDIKVADLEYQISSNLAETTFPKRLPNLYKDKVLSIYGRYGREDQAIGLRITGLDSLGIRREIVVGGTIADAVTVDQRLVQNWARQYIYHLYSLLSVKYDENIKNQIHDIASRYKLTIPYLDKHLVQRRKNYVK